MLTAIFSVPNVTGIAGFTINQKGAVYWRILLLHYLRCCTYRTSTRFIFLLGPAPLPTL